MPVSAARKFTCNIGITDITPKGHVVLAGFAARKGLSTTVQTPLRSHSLVICSPKGEKVCIITNDMMELDIEETTEMRDSISARTGLPIDHIYIHNIHTHSAPRTGGSSTVPGGSNYEYSLTYQKMIVDNAVRTILSDNDFKPFTMQFGETTCAINMNRGEKDGPCTHKVYVLRLMGKDHKPIVSLVNYCCHPVSLGPGSHVVSADFPGFETMLLQRAWGGEVFHFTSAAGNVDPIGGPKRDTLNSYNKGKQMADSILMKIRFRDIKMNTDFAVCSAEAHLPFRVEHIDKDTILNFAQSILNNPVEVSPTWKQDVRGWYRQMLREYDEGLVKDYLPVRIAGVNIGGFPILFTQGEPFNEYDVQLRKKVGKPMLFIAYTNGQNSYLPSAHAYDTPYYAYEKDQMFVYVKSPYPLSSKFPIVYSKALYDVVKRALAPTSNSPRYSIIPQPKELTETKGDFLLNGKTLITITADDNAFQEVADNFARQLYLVSGLKIKVIPGMVLQSNYICFQKVDGMSNEAYELSVEPRRIVIKATSAHGAYYGVQTIFQLLPPEVYGDRRTKGIKWSLPCCEIKDEPRFRYRGMMLDCARHFLPKEFVKKFIDLLAMHKQNMFHWHLTDDQGWRIEIKKYPRLTEVGSRRLETTDYDGKNSDYTPHGGYYTQEDVKDIVDYARQRFVTVIPEIEMPGHASAAIAAYPEIAVFPDRTYHVATGWGVKKDVMAPTVRTFQFLDDVFSELLPLLPSVYYSFGGDECPRDQWRESSYCRDLMKILGTDDAGDLQAIFATHMERFLSKNGKRAIGWDEILDNGAMKSTIVLSYRGHAPAYKAVWRNMDVVMCPNRWCYLDYYQEDPDKEQKSQDLFLPLRKVYDYFPIGDTLSASRHKYIMGVQGCIWGEYCQDAKRAEYLGFPRTVALSEVGWCDRGNKNFQNFCARMLKDFRRLDAKHVAYSKAFFNVIFNFDRKKRDYPQKLKLTIDYPNAVIRYTTDGKAVTPHSQIYDGIVTVVKGTIVKARAYLGDRRPVGIEVSKTF